MKISDILLVTDLDGTLIPKFADVHEKDLKAINRFKALGGKLTIATGRTHETSKEYIEKFGIDIPMVACNGGLLYDFIEDKAIYAKILPSTYRAVMKELSTIDGLVEMYAVDKPSYDVGIEALTEKNVYIARECSHFDRHHMVLGDRCISSPIESFPVDLVLKAIFAGDENIIRLIDNYAKNLHIDGLEFMLSAPTCFEILPTDVSKGQGVKRLSELLNIKRENIFAIGDYNNDLSMIEYASVSACFENSPDALKNCASFICPKCEDGGFSHFIDYIIDNYND